METLGAIVLGIILLFLWLSTGSTGLGKPHKRKGFAEVNRRGKRK